MTSIILILNYNILEREKKKERKKERKERKEEKDNILMNKENNY